MEVLKRVVGAVIVCNNGKNIRVKMRHGAEVAGTCQLAHLTNTNVVASYRLSA